MPVRKFLQVGKNQFHGSYQFTQFLRLQYLVVFTLPFQRQHLPVAPAQFFGQVLVSHIQPFGFQKLFLIQSSTVHFSGTIHHVVGLIYQKDIGAPLPICKISLEIHIGIKYIIVIANDSIHPVAQIQRKFKRAHLMFLCISQDTCPVCLFLMTDQVIHCLIDPFKIPLCHRTRHWIALHPTHGTHFFFCSDGEGSQFHALPPQDGHTFLCYSSGNGLCRQVKNLFQFALPHSLHAGKDGRKGLPNTGGCLDKQCLFPDNAAVDGNHQIFLTFPIRKWKLHALQRCISHLPVADQKGGPSGILPQIAAKFFFQSWKGVHFLKLSDFL